MINFIPFGQPDIDSKDIKAVVNVLKSRWLGRGPAVDYFEKKFKKYKKIKYAVALNSCSSALVLALKSLGVGPRDEVITTPITFAATVNAILNVGAIPVFADVERDTYNICPEEIIKNITARTKAILVVHVAGRPCRMDKIKMISRQHDLPIIEDCAHAIESKYQEKQCGTIGDVGCFSFDVGKNITAGNGGMLITSHKKIAENVKIKSQHGISRGAWERRGGDNFYQVCVGGFNYAMNDISAALGFSQFNKLGRNYKKREKIWRYYMKSLSGIDELLLPAPIGEDIKHAYHLFSVTLKTEKLNISRNKFLIKLKENKVGAGIHFLALHEQPAFKNFLTKKSYLPNAEFISERTISLPLYPHLTPQKMKYIIKTVKKIIYDSRKKSVDSK